METDARDRSGGARAGTVRTSPGVRTTRGRAGLVASLLTAALTTAACTSPSAPVPTPPPRPVHYTAAADLESRVGAAIRRDATATTTTAATVTNGAGAAPVPLAPRDGALSVRPQGVFAHAYFPVSYEQVPQNLVEVIMVAGISNGTVYVVPPAFLGLGMPAGRTWVGPIRAAEPSVTHTRGAEENLAGFATSAVVDAIPTMGFDSTVFGPSAQIVGATDDTVDGVPAVKYDIHVDIAAAAQQQADPEKKRILQERYLNGGTLVSDTTLWVDVDDRPLRASTRTSGPASSQTIDIRYRNWGAQVPIDPPPPGSAAWF